MRGRIKLAELALSAVLAVFGHLPLAHGVSATETPSLRGIYNALGGTMSPAWVAQDLGLFTKHGLQHSLNYLAVYYPPGQRDSHESHGQIYEDG